MKAHSHGVPNCEECALQRQAHEAHKNAVLSAVRNWVIGVADQGEQSVRAAGIALLEYEAEHNIGSACAALRKFRKGAKGG